MDGNLQALRPPLRADLPAEPSAGQALQRIARDCIQEIHAQEARLRRSRSPEALHQIRVALRRWRTALGLFGPASSASLDRTRATLKWLARELNDARDLDVFAEALEPGRQESPGARMLWTALEAARTQAYRRADEALQSDRLRRLLWRTAQDARPKADADATPAREVAAESLQRRWRKLGKRGRKLATMAPPARHALRIQAKKLRYAAELSGGMFSHPGRQARLGKALKRLQDSLGVLNDLAVGEAIALRLARQTGSPEAAFAAGRLAGSRGCQEEAKVLKAARDAYEDFRDAGRFWTGSLAG